MWNKFKAFFTKPIFLIDPYWLDTIPDYDTSLSKPYRKPSDTTPLTRGMVKFILEVKKLQEDHNSFYGKNRDHVYETTQELCAYINMVFGTNFSRSKISRVWSSNFDSSNLLEGIEYTIPF